MNAKLTTVLAGLVLTGPALAQDEPLSAIDWLSRSVTSEAAIISDVTADEPPVTNDARAPEVRVTPLDSPSPDPVGLLSSATTGLPSTLWSRSDNETLVTLIQAEMPPALPAMQDLLRSLMLAEADPPLGAGPDGTLFLARVDKLLDMGALPEAQAMLELADPLSPPLFRRWFDVALLTGTEDAACAVMEARPAVAPTYPARIFCLARSGDWTAAALTLNTHRVLGDVTEAEEALLSRFLDPELYEGEPLAAPERVSPLIFRMREAIGAYLTTSALPLAFAHADLRDTAGWKAQLEAAERLARKGALPGTVLADLYSDRRPSASGGVWDRAAAFQAFDRAITDEDSEAVAETLPVIWQTMQSIRSEVLFADLYATSLQAIPLTGEADRLATEIGLLSDDYLAIARGNPDADAFLRALALGEPQTATAPTDMARAIQSAFNGAAPPPALARLAEDGKTGEAVLRAMAVLESGMAGDPKSITDALALFRLVGLEDTARRTALQLMLLERGS